MMNSVDLMDGRLKNVPLLTVTKTVLEQPLFLRSKQTDLNQPTIQGSLQPKEAKPNSSALLLATGLLDRFRGFADHRVDPCVAHHRLAFAHLQRHCHAEDGATAFAIRIHQQLHS